jgi:hypothetical protein
MVQSQPRQIVHKTLSPKKKKITKNGGGGVAQGVGPEFKPQYHIKKHGPTKKNVLQLIMNKEP